VSELLLSVKNLNVHFGGVHALRDISFDIPDQGIYGIIGPNGAGKTTLFNCISGFVRPTAGSSIRFLGEELVGEPVHRIARRGIARTFQGIALNRVKTVRQNLMTGLHQSLSYSPWRALFPSRYVLAAEREAQESIDQVLDLLGLPTSVLETIVDVLPLGLQKKVEVARAIVAKPRVILLDEPAGGLNDAETNDLCVSLLRLKMTPDLTIVLVDHDMNLVMRLCDKIFVVSSGQKIAEGSTDHVRNNPAVISSYLGEAEDA
jgi:branched-chain amino acid transport system ATP-binding protein